MPAKRNANVSPSLPAETRRRTGGRASATAQKKRIRGGVEDFIRLTDYMRESGWDGFDYKEQRKQFGRWFDDIG